MTEDKKRAIFYLNEAVLSGAGAVLADGTPVEWVFVVLLGVCCLFAGANLAGDWYERNTR